MRYVFVGLIVLSFQVTILPQSPDRLIKISDDLELIQITDDAFIHVSYKMTAEWGRVGANGLLLRDKKQAILFDSPWTEEQTASLISWIRDRMKLDIRGFIPNHWHEDCMGGLGYIHEQGIKSYANQMTVNLAETHTLPVPQFGFTDSLELRLGEKEIFAYYPGAAHSMDNIVIWIPSEKILFPACMVKEMRARNLGNTADGDLLAYPETLMRLEKKFPAARIVIPGHGDYGGPELIEHTLTLTD